MKTQISSYKKYAGILVLGVAFTQLYQNCGQLATFEAGSAGDLMMGSTSVSDIDHPSVKEVTLPSQKILTINRKATASLLRDVFESPNYPIPSFEVLVQQWVGTRGPQFGGACNAYDTNSGLDCGDINNVNLAIQQDDSTLRESFHVQFCENVMAYDQAVNSVLEKVNPEALTPDAKSVGRIYQLFYRAEEPSSAIVGTLIDMDRALAQKGESTVDRWRAVILQVCSSTGWQLL